MTTTAAPAPATPIFASMIADQLMPILRRELPRHRAMIINLQDRFSVDDPSATAYDDLDRLTRELIMLAPIIPMIIPSESDLETLIDIVEDMIMEF